MKNYKKTLAEMRTFLLLWVTQSFSALGSAMTSYALVIWSYRQKGSALMTALIMVCSYAPYVIFSIFAGALSDRWNKKMTMLVCDTIAAMTTVIMLIFMQKHMLQIWHIYLINIVNGLMNTVQQPASEVAVTRLLPKKYYQRVGGMRYFASSLNSILTPIIATAVLGIAGMGAVIGFDLFTFVIAFLTLTFFITLPEEGNGLENVNQTRMANQHKSNEKEPKEGQKGDGEDRTVLRLAKEGIIYLKRERGIFDLILFLAAINFVASIYDAAFPAMILSRKGGSEKVLGLVNAVIGISTLLGSILASFAKTPKSRVRVICNCLLFSMSFENFMLALGRTPLIWCIGGFLGWIAIPLMNTNLDAIMRLRIPEDMQGRVYSVRNSFQFFTIPVGYFLGGFLVDKVFEPIMSMQPEESFLVKLFGAGYGSGAAFLFFILAFVGISVCLYFRRDKNLWKLEK